MRKAIVYIVGVALLMMSCDCSILEYPENGGIDPTKIHVNLTLETDPSLEPYSKDGSDASPDGMQAHDVRWIIEIFRDAIGGDPAERLVIGCDPAPDRKNTIEAAFDLHAAKYHIVAWMDYVDDGSLEDKYYSIQSLSSVSIPENGDYIGNNDFKDAYAGSQELDLTVYRNQWGTSLNRTVTLERPMAKIEIVTTDLDKLDAQTAATDLSSWEILVEYAGYFPSGFNAYTDKPNDAREGVSFTGAMSILSAQEARLGSDYVFVNGNESAVYVNLTVYDGNKNVLNQVRGIEVPIVRGKLTSIRGEFLTKDFNSGIGIDPDFDGDIDIVIPD